VTKARGIVIDVAGLTKSSNGHTVVRDVRMQVERGTIYGFLGPDGLGKTTTTAMRAAYAGPRAGDVSGLRHPERDG
jgi:ABC-2 type transport system ATP-binding protein